jgi:hypothetical protein
MQLKPMRTDLLFAEPEKIRRRNRSLSDHYGFRGEFDLEATSVAPIPRGLRELDREAIDLARGLLNVGREEADRREQAHFRSAGTWAMGAVLAAGLRRHPALDRRRFLQSSAGVLAVIALTPAVGYGTLARVDSDRKRDAFDDAHDILAQLEARPNETA